MTSTNRSLTALGALVLLAGSAFAQSTSSKKAVFVSGNTQILAAAGDTVMTGQIKTSDVGDLLIGVSLECSLWTATSNTAKKGGGQTTSTSKAGLNVKVFVDGQEATPAQVVFCEREQQVNLTFVPGTEDLNDDSILLDIFLKTKSANHFNFFYENPGNDLTHTVEVVVDSYVEASGEPQIVVDNTRAVVGERTLVIEEYNNP